MEEQMVIANHPLVRDGRSQESRRIPALSPESVKIDGRSWEDMLTYVFELSRQINFFDEKLQRNADWQAFFHLSGPILIARISKFDIKTVEKNYETAVANFLSGLNRGNPKPLFSRQYELADTLTQWYQNLASDPGEFRLVFRNLIHTNLKFALHRLTALGKSAPAIEAGYDPNYYLHIFSSEPIWELDKDAIQPAVFVRASRDTMRRELERRLRETYQLWIKGLEQIVHAAPQYFTQSLQISTPGQPPVSSVNTEDAFQSHEPHLGLLFSFLKLFEQVRDRLNAHSKNHLEYYYKRILRLTEQAAVPDQSHLVFEVSDPLPSFVLPKGTLFTAGEDALGVEQHFQLDEELLVQRARIANLRTLFFDQKQVTKNQKPFKLIKGAFSALPANSGDGQGAGFDGIEPPSWPTLGRKLSRMPDPNIPGRIVPHPPARLGLALASRVLFLQEGRRIITFQLLCKLPEYLQDVNGADYRSFQDAINTKFLFTAATTAGLIEAGISPDKARVLAINYGPAAKNALEFKSFLKGVDAPAAALALPKIIERTLAFKVSLSGEKEIFQPYAVEIELKYENGQGRLLINVELDTEDSPVVYFDPAVYGFDLGTRLPTALLELQSELYFFIQAKDENDNSISEQVSLYQAFREMQIVDSSIEVEVLGMRNVVVQNADGPQDPASPFPPFGAVPKPGTDFYIGSSEAFHKRLYSPAPDKPGLSIRMAWDELPGSFFEHYRMYGAQLLRSDFNGSLSLRNSNAWIPLDEGPKQQKQLLTDLKIQVAGSVTAPVFTVSKETEILIENLPGQTSDTKQEPKAILGYALFLALDPANYQKQDLSAEGRYRFVIQVPGTPSGPQFAQTKKFPNGKNKDEAINDIVIALTRAEVVLTVNDFGNIQATAVEEQTEFTIASRNGFLRLQLGSQDFLHSRFSVVLPTQSAAIALSAQLAAIKPLIDALPDPKPTSIVDIIENAYYRKNADPSNVAKGTAIKDEVDVNTLYTAELPNEPHTPMLKEISIDYRAQAVVHELEAYHLYPFEKTNYQKLNLLEQSPGLLPVFTDPEAKGAPVEKEGSLYIALEELAPGNTLSLLFQVAEATADPDLEEIKPSWHYLRDNQWVRLEPDEQVLSDETKGLIVSGVVQLAIPRNINRNNTILPAAYYWLKVSVPARSAAASQTIAIITQAARVSFVPREGNDFERLAQPLPAELIADFVDENPSIKSVLQPYNSFGGKPAEKEDRFYTRVSERLQHKGRNITLFDYETLLLENFPEVFRAKCVTHTLGRRGQPSDFELAPGYLTVAVIPDLREHDFANRLEPKFSIGALQKMEEFLKARCSPFVRLQVLNPRYQRVSIEGKIKFRKGKSAEFYRLVLEKEVTNFLAPWASGEQDRISFGGEIFKSYVLNFIEQRHYVDYITDFIMRDDLGKEVNEVTARSARSILVSGPHILDILE